MGKISEKSWRSSFLRSLPWLIVGGMLIAALLHELLQPAWFRALPPLARVGIWSEVLLLFGLGYLALRRLEQLYQERRQTLQRLDEAEKLVAEAYRRMEALVRLNQQFAETDDARKVLEAALHLLVALKGVCGASFVPLDEHNQPQAALRVGEIPSPGMESWIEYLASPGVRDRCRLCAREGQRENGTPCPLLTGPFSGASRVTCLPVRRGEREYGFLNLFLEQDQALDEREGVFLNALLDALALGLEGVRFRQQERAALQHIQAIRRQADLASFLQTLLHNVRETLDTDYAVLKVLPAGGKAIYLTSAAGAEGKAAGNNHSSPFLEAILQSAISSGEAALIGDVQRDLESGGGALQMESAPISKELRSLAVAPLITSEGKAVGAVIVGSRRARGLHPRQLAVLQTLARQAGLMVQNADWLAEVEYKAVMQERTRLAREIHDGLAQTLGFLKLQVAQMRSALARGEAERLNQMAELLYSALAEAYEDARQALDGLRIAPFSNHLQDWLLQTIRDFEESAGVPINLDMDGSLPELPPEVQAQLIRIVQEALNNVRKHAHATQVWVAAHGHPGCLELEIRDNGAGFQIEDITGPSQHGLRGMRERARLIGAALEVISQPQAGTAVRLELPVLMQEEVWQ